jgi:hypothetical protein
MDQKQRKTTTTLVNGQTQYVTVGGSNGMKVERMTQFALTVDHPGGSTTTAYTVQASNMTDLEASLGQDDWIDDTSVATIPSKTAAEKFGIKVTKASFSRYRLKAVTSAGGGTCTVREQRKASS